MFSMKIPSAMSAAVLAAVLISPAPLRAGETLPSPFLFDVYYGDTPIGHHNVTFEHDGNDLIARVDIALTLKLGFITLYEYSHKIRETVRDGRLVALEASADDNGSKKWLRARLTDKGLKVESSGGSFTAPPDLLPTTYWRPETPKQSRLLDTQEGTIINVSIRPIVRKRVMTPEGEEDATVYAVRGDREFDLLYDDLYKWLGVHFRFLGGDVNYRPVPPPRRQAKTEPIPAEKGPDEPAR